MVVINGYSHYTSIIKAFTFTFGIFTLFIAHLTLASPLLVLCTYVKSEIKILQSSNTNDYFTINI